MSSLKVIISLLEKRIGLSADAIGSKTLAKAVQNRLEARGLSDRKAYLAYLQTSKEEWEALIESVVVKETWFFRTKESFTFLGQYVQSKWLSKYAGTVLRVLSIPCATGEEPYSIAMTLIDAGLAEGRFQIDGVDISREAIYKAILGVYGEESFRNKDALAFRDRFFEKTVNGYQIRPSLKGSVRFMEGNLLDSGLLSDEDSYHMIFCRNLLIYYNTSSRKRAISIVDHSLAEAGVLFVGHAERSFFNDFGFVWFRQPGVFACQKLEASQEFRDPAPLKTVEQGTKGQGDREDSAFAGRMPALKSVEQKIERIVEKDPSIVLSAEEKKLDSAYSQKEQEYVPPSHRITFERRERRENSVGKTGFSGFRGRRTAPDEDIKLLDTAREMANHGDLEEALHLCKEVLNNNAVHVQAHFLIGLLYQAFKNDALAEEYFSKTLYLDPNHYDALHHLSFIVEQRGNHDKARRLRQRAQRIFQRQKS